MTQNAFNQGNATPPLLTPTNGRARPDAALIDDWHVVAFSKDISEGQLTPTRLLGEELVIWRHEGKVHVWKDLCIHRGAQLSKGWVVEGTVVCPYHGWRYNCDAKCVLIPAQPQTKPPLKARAFPHRCEERYGMVWATLGNPSHDIPLFPEATDPTFRMFNAGPYPFNANCFRSVENFIDATHFPFVHAGLNGVMDAPDKLEDYTVSKGPDGLATSGIKVYQPYGDHRQVPVFAEYRYRCMRPNAAYFSKSVCIADPKQEHRGGDNDRFCTFLTAQPLDEVTCIIRLAVAINFGPELTEADILRRQDLVFSQDRAIVETQHPERIPIDLRQELHLRSDRLGLEYRRWLKELGVTYGTLGDEPPQDFDVTPRKSIA
jgi:phenylpropionate dioxygenase-like ring-hydroxylating dioxygenase large terminal subunit